MCHDSHRSSSLRKPAQPLRRSFTRTAARARHDTSLSTDRRPGLLLDLEKYRARERIQKYANVRFVKDDVRFFGLLSYFLQSERIDTVMHFAAQSHVDNSRRACERKLRKSGDSCTFARMKCSGKTFWIQTLSTRRS